MAKVEIEETQLTALTNAMKLLGELNSKPDARVHLERSIKAVRPDIEIEEEAQARLVKPMQERIDQMEKQLQEERAAREEREAARRDEEADAAMHARFKKLRDEGYTDEGIAKVAAYMKDNYVADPLAAAAYLEKMNPKPAIAESAYEPQRYQLVQTGDNLPTAKDWFTNQAATLDSQIAAAINENRQKQFQA